MYSISSFSSDLRKRGALVVSLSVGTNTHQTKKDPFKTKIDSIFLISGRNAWSFVPVMLQLPPLHSFPKTENQTQKETKILDKNFDVKKIILIFALILYIKNIHL